MTAKSTTPAALTWSGVTTRRTPIRVTSACDAAEKTMIESVRPMYATPVLIAE